MPNSEPNVQWWRDPRVNSDALVRRIPVGERIIYAIPDRRDATWVELITDRPSRLLMMELARLGFEYRGEYEARLYLQTRGERPALVVLVPNQTDPTTIER